MSTEDIANKLDRLDKVLDNAFDIKVKTMALDYAIKSGAGNTYNDCGMLMVDSDKIVEAAKKFETYVKGTTNV